MMTSKHEGRPSNVVQTGQRGRVPESYVALALPEDTGN